MKQGCFIQAYMDVLTACPEVRHHTPSATIVLIIKDTFGVSRAGVGSGCQDRERQGSRDRAYTDVLVAGPGNHYPRWLPTDK